MVTIGGQRIEIINVYAPRKTETKDALNNHTPLPNCLLDGNFNRHHGDRYGPLAADRAKFIVKFIPSATFLIYWTEAHGLLLLNKPGHQTHFPKNGTSPPIPDATLASGSLHTACQSWYADYGESSDLDQALITTLLHIGPYKFVP